MMLLCLGAHAQARYIVYGSRFCVCVSVPLVFCKLLKTKRWYVERKCKSTRSRFLIGQIVKKMAVFLWCVWFAHPAGSLAAIQILAKAIQSTADCRFQLYCTTSVMVTLRISCSNASVAVEALRCLDTVFIWIIHKFKFYLFFHSR